MKNQGQKQSTNERIEKKLQDYVGKANNTHTEIIAHLVRLSQGYTLCGELNVTSGDQEELQYAIESLSS